MRGHLWQIRQNHIDGKLARPCASGMTRPRIQRVGEGRMLYCCFATSQF
jgi:hypothetical protein